MAFFVADGTGSRACKLCTGLSSVASVFSFALLLSSDSPDDAPPSGGRVESPCKGLSDMDVARATMGQGWPFVAGPWSGDGRREPRRSRGRMSGCPSLWLLSLGQARESDSPVRGETKMLARYINEPVPEAGSATIRKHKPANPASSAPSLWLPTKLRAIAARVWCANPRTSIDALARAAHRCKS